MVPAGGIVEQVVRGVVDQAVRCARDQEAPVGERGAQARAEPAIGQRERPGQPVVERQVMLGPVAHAGRGCLRRGVGVFPAAVAGLRLHLLRAGHEAVALTLTPLQVGAVPALLRHPLALDRGGLVKGADDLAVGPRVGDVGLAIGPQRESVTPALEHAEVVVVGMVLHHQHHDVLDLRQEVGARGQGRPGKLARFLLGLLCRAAAREAPHLMPFNHMPHVDATLGLRPRSGVRCPASSHKGQMSALPRTHVFFMIRYRIMETWLGVPGRPPLAACRGR